MGEYFGKRLRAERLARGLTQAQLGGDVYSPSYVSLLEVGRREPTPEVIGELARRLGLAPSDLGVWGRRVDPSDGEYLLATLMARQAWDLRDYARAADAAAVAAESALHAKNVGGWWDMAYVQAECLMKQGQLAESQGILHRLLEHPIVTESTGLAVRALRMLSSVCRGLGHLGEAIEHGRDAVRLSAQLPAGTALHIGALRALIAALAEAGDLDEAWTCCQTLGSLVDEESAWQLLGDVEWVIGNVAFMRADYEEGVKRHERAAKLLSPANDLELWARFNKATAAVRLAGGLVEPETLQAIERAELALSIVGGSRHEQLEVALIRARWHYLNDQTQEALERLQEINPEKDILGHHTAGDIALLHGQTLQRLGRTEEAAKALEEACRHLEQARPHDGAREGAPA